MEPAGRRAQRAVSGPATRRLRLVARRARPRAQRVLNHPATVALPRRTAQGPIAGARAYPGPRPGWPVTRWLMGRSIGDGSGPLGLLRRFARVGRDSR